MHQSPRNWCASFDYKSVYITCDTDGKIMLVYSVQDELFNGCIMHGKPGMALSIIRFFVWWQGNSIRRCWYTPTLFYKE